MDVKTNKKVDINVDINIPGHTPYPPYPPYPYPQPDYQQNIINFESGEFNYASDAEDSFNAALQQLKERGYTILEAGVNWNKYIINFIAPNGDRVERYVSGQYTVMSDAEESLTQTTKSLKTRGYVVLEGRINSGRDSFTISYLVSAYSPYPYPGPYYPTPPNPYPNPGTCGKPTVHGTPYSGGGCNVHGCWLPGGGCNVHGCSAYGECNVHGCPAKITGESRTCNVSYQPNPYNPQPYNPYPGTGICGEPNVYGTPVLGGGCNVYGCWLPGGSCNVYGCSRYGECNVYGCPAKIESQPCKR